MGLGLTKLGYFYDICTINLKRMKILIVDDERAIRYSLKEIMVFSTVDVKELQKNVDRIAKELREVDEKIQGANWTIDLI